MRDFLRHWSPRAETQSDLRQAGALPYALVEGRVAFLLITSRRSGKWIFPKGAIEPDMTPWDSAAVEALEEAGVSGRIDHEPVGSYRASVGADGVALVDVDLYPLLVTEQRDSWREQDQRLRHWATLSEARRLLTDRSLGNLALKLHNRLVPAAGK
ncbi:NUDIX domain-containing protein [Devosia lucknowensis]|uniref:NUDIX domain-containing protein n=1 Tax=Devosia lucknowensis TaxID=1096929 RepID=A0A1Y6F1W4_9HYPH|nr:NUDIX hydrolase [Devosia lucknowensis]SMQ68888.1 NUDIX domain-containing protein [Devosia lucknowensis]